MHLQWHEAGALGTNAIVGGGVPLGAGNAWAQRHAGTDDVDGLLLRRRRGQHRSVLETMNLAAAWELPICFFIENNLYAVSTTVAEATGEPRLSGRGPGFGIASWRVDGMDPLAVHLAMTGRGRAHARRQRTRGRSRRRSTATSTRTAPSPAAPSATAPRRRRAWRDRDPLDLMARKMVALGLIDDDGIAAVRRQAQDVDDRRSPAS